VTDQTTPAAPGDTGATPPAAASWYQATDAAQPNYIDAETAGWLQNRGFADKPPSEAFAAAVKAHREAERHIGVPADQILRRPKDAADEANWAPIRELLNVPAKPEDYTFDGIKFADGSDLDPALTGELRNLAHSLGLSKDRAPELAKALVKMGDDAEAVEKTDMTAKLQAERDALKNNWGPGYEANMVVARAAFETVLKESGMKPEEFGVAMSALENQVGYKGLMEVFRTIGMRTGEDRLVSNFTGSGSNGLMTREGAAARIAELKSDSAWVERYLNGDNAAGREMGQLNAILASE